MSRSQNAGIRSVLVLTGYGTKHQLSLDSEPKMIVEHFGKGVENIISLVESHTAIFAKVEYELAVFPHPQQ